MRHQTLSHIQWQDLRQLRPLDVVYNVLLSLPFLLLSWWSVAQGWWLLALIASFFFFTAALRQAHDCYHRTLGVNQLATELMLFVLSVTMLCSTHAIRHTHLNHHQDPLGESDVEGNWARLPWYQAILGGGFFSVAIQWFGLTKSNRRNRLLVIIDMALIIAVIMSAVITQHPILVYHVVVMIVANMMVGFFAVWTVHHGCDEVVYARSERQPMVNLLTFNLLYHMEHHLFPAVPTNHLPELAKRLDADAPQWTKQAVVPNIYGSLGPDKQGAGHTSMLNGGLNQPSLSVSGHYGAADNMTFQASRHQDETCPLRAAVTRWWRSK